MLYPPRQLPLLFLRRRRCQAVVEYVTPVHLVVGMTVTRVIEHILSVRLSLKNILKPKINKN